MTGSPPTNSSKQAGADLPPDSEIPPAIACARCGLSSCDGCAPEFDADIEPPELPPSGLRWEQNYGSHRERLLESALTTVRAPEATFAQMGQGSLTAALTFAFACEFWAVLSFSLPWGLGFFALFPRLTFQMLSSPSVLLLGSGIFIAIVIAVIGIHLVWGASLEWGIARTKTKAQFASGLRFGFYACGWDLITSPAGYLLLSLQEGRKAAWDTFRAGARVPRRAMNAYLEKGRQVSAAKQKTAVRTGIWITAVMLLAPIISGFAALLLWMLSY